MAHIRTDLRTAVLTVLDGAKPVGWSVSADRGRAVDPSGMPALVFGFSAEQAERRSRPDGPDKRMIRLETTLYVTGSGVDASLDAACAWVEKALAADPLLGGLSEDVIYRETRFEIFAGGEMPVGQAVLAHDIRASRALTLF